MERHTYVQESLGELWMWLSWQSTCPVCTKLWVLLPALHPPPIAVHARNPSIQETEARALQVRCHPWLHGGFEASLGFQ